MKFCFFHFFPYTDVRGVEGSWPVSTRNFDPARAHALYASSLETLRFAEECGFDWVGINEHHFSPYSMMPNCNIVGGALAYATTRVKIAIMGNLIPLANPIRVAEEYAMLDCMSGGRVIAGLMRGIPHEYLAYNIPPSESWERQKEAVALILKAWTEPEPFGWEGKHFQYKAVSIWPKPLQQPHPPLVVSASTVDSARFAGSIGASMGIVRYADLDTAKACIAAYTAAAHTAGWQPGPENVLLGVNVCIADTDAEARAALAPALDFFINVLNGPARTAQRLVLQQTRYHQAAATSESYEKSHARQPGASLDTLIANGNIICGSPETALVQFRRIALELNAGVFNMVMKLGNIDDGVVRHGMELFRDRVAPALRETELSPAH